MTEDEFRVAIAFGREQRHIEFKSPGPRTDKHLFAKVLRGMLGMANKAHGGYVIVGVEDDGSNLHAKGMNATDLATWNYDDLASNVAEYTDPFVTFDSKPLTVDGKTYAVIEVEQFESVPILCKKDYPNVLKDGACYVRGYHKIETIEVNSHILMRELIDRATEIQIKKELERLQNLGLLIFAELKSSPSDDQRFDDQMGDLS